FDESGEARNQGHGHPREEREEERPSCSRPPRAPLRGYALRGPAVLGRTSLPFCLHFQLSGPVPVTGGRFAWRLGCPVAKSLQHAPRRSARTPPLVSASQTVSAAGGSRFPELILIVVTAVWGATFLVIQIGLRDAGPFGL